MLQKISLRHTWERPFSNWHCSKDCFTTTIIIQLPCRQNIESSTDRFPNPWSFEVETSAAPNHIDARDRHSVEDDYRITRSKVTEAREERVTRKMRTRAVDVDGSVVRRALNYSLVSHAAPAPERTLAAACLCRSREEHTDASSLRHRSGKPGYFHFPRPFSLRPFSKQRAVLAPAFFSNLGSIFSWHFILLCVMYVFLNLS